MGDLGVFESGKDALDAFLHDRGEEALFAAKKRIHGGLGCPARSTTRSIVAPP